MERTVGPCDKVSFLGRQRLLLRHEEEEQDLRQPKHSAPRDLVVYNQGSLIVNNPRLGVYNPRDLIVYNT